MISAGNRQQTVNSEKDMIILSAGGTGGHMFPAFALAEMLRERGLNVALITDSRGQKYESAYPHIPFHVVRAQTLKAGIITKIKTVISLGVGTLQAIRILKKLEPKAVVGFGGYPSLPAMMAAALLNIPTILHEQNAVLGRANQFMATSATKLALSLPNMDGMRPDIREKATVTGNPVRAEIAAIGTKNYTPPHPEGPFKILILGGSQGAQVFSTLLPDALEKISGENQKRLSIVQQCRAIDIAGVRHTYDVMGIRAKLETFISDVPAQLEACHLLIGRAGASTVTETAMAGRPALFVPYPHHKDQQQKVNALVLVKAGAAHVFDEKTLTADTLAKTLENLMNSPTTLADMAEAARKTLPQNAAKNLADLVTTL
jgi:UDP-N-acetylglucosamine--N-acetylmuramyl-(pentapeptide) pyrophosphoryl-undecaprenol N-acetylglucosamine transferase